VSAPPLIVLGVRRSGTTLLRVMLDRHSELAVPDESYFLPQLDARHGKQVDVEEFLDDLNRIPTIREWEIDLSSVGFRIGRGATLGEAVSAVYEEYAAARGKQRWGDKTPMYMQHLRMLERLFPDARFVHLIRDGRDTALSFLSMPRGVVTETWAHPKTVADFACQWQTEVVDARELGRRVGDRDVEVRYEEVVGDPERELRRICAFAGLDYEPRMLGYADEVDVSQKPHQQSLKKPPTPGLRDWRTAMGADDVIAFEQVAGKVLDELGYDVANRRFASAPSARGRARLSRYRAVTAAWRLAARALQRSPAWRRRHPRLV